MRSAIIVIVTLLTACQTSEVSREVGARCTDADECDERCLVPSTSYPGGFCTLACNSRDECPDDTTCADHDGGVCLFQCSGNMGCGFLGTGWRCSEANLRGGTTQVMVCRGT